MLLNAVFLPLVLLISRSAHSAEVCVFVVALCGFACSTHPKQPAPTQLPDVGAAQVKEQLRPPILNHVLFWLGLAFFFFFFFSSS